MRIRLHNPLLAKIKKIGYERLAVFSGSTAPEITHSFLFRDDKFCGIKFTTGLFGAVWMDGSSEIRVMRSGDLIDRVALVSDSQSLGRAA